MSYNCDNWKTKKLENFKIPIESLFKHHNWYPDRTNNNDGTVTFWIMETRLHGLIHDGWFTVSFIDCSGEGSGTIMHETLEPAFKDSLGELEAICIWEHGDSINKIIVKDGKVSWENIEL